MKPADINSFKYIEYGVEHNHKDHKILSLKLMIMEEYQKIEKVFLQRTTLQIVLRKPLSLRK